MAAAASSLLTYTQIAGEINMTFEVGTVVAIAVPVVGGLAWLFRLEGRINVQEAITRELSSDVRYIRERIDVALYGSGRRRAEHD